MPCTPHRSGVERFTTATRSSRVSDVQRTVWNLVALRRHNRPVPSIFDRLSHLRSRPMTQVRASASHDHGFGVLEAIVALVVAAVALQALYAATGTSLRAAQRSKLHLEALALAQSTLLALASRNL